MAEFDVPQSLRDAVLQSLSETEGKTADEVLHAVGDFEWPEAQPRAREIVAMLEELEKEHRVAHHLRQSKPFFRKRTDREFEEWRNVQTGKQATFL